jgi:hypothetical protein
VCTVEHRCTRALRLQEASWARFSAKDHLSKSWYRVPVQGYITKGALDTRWCHYQTLAPTQLEGEKPAPEDENDREKGRKSKIL